MNKNEEAVLISLIFLGLWAYMMYTFQGLGLELPVVGSFNFESISRYVVLIGLVLGFILFLWIRREKRAEEQPTAEHYT